ncbi:MAG: bifunctional phosphoribosylaminoimidazolecarboxamide formyltransferase/IMP cyclohydrolase [Opitutales bacterium]|nr:bifunctional phosphoribosylaminoimidazolecarboxamide formyltransferase/IMP cyclohydrolase [Opitutales bacterium]NRA27097.1 bifunctional phosphoribosylaminoimidazolecarboxamide formyltransferase/IMP cyclohydrolase [Opitutales bacterium]
MARTALISVSDKAGLVPFAEALAKLDFRILSTGGTAHLLRDAGLEVTDVSDYTGFPEMMEGRVKTLHPKVHGGLLCRRDKTEHTTVAAEHGIDMIDLVVVNLYPFEATVAKTGVTVEEAIENIDIGGPSMLRSAAKNHASVTVVTDPTDYDRVIEAFQSGSDFLPLRKELALKVYQRTATYDAAISGYLAKVGYGPESDALPEAISLSLPKTEAMRYGENPHQAAALYGNFHDFFEQLHGKALSFNNIVDTQAAADLMDEFHGGAPTVAIVKHTNPCGVASGDSLRAAWDAAFETDRQAPFGGIIAMNHTCDLAIAEAIREIFCEIIIAPDFEPDALALLQKKKNLRLMRQLKSLKADRPLDIKTVVGGLLVQEADTEVDDVATFEVVTQRQPTEEEWASMLFGWKVVKHVKSNAVIYTKGSRTIGIGAGQMSRVDSSRIAVWKAGEAGLPLAGSTVCSDALIPFADGLVAAAEAGATACIQTGGSLRDDEVIAAADQHEMAMVITRTRHFKH